MYWTQGWEFALSLFALALFTLLLFALSLRELLFLYRALRGNHSFCSFVKEGRERFSLVAIFKRVRKAIESNWLSVFFIKAKQKSVILIFKSSFLQKGVKPNLKKSKLLFHKEWIALVFDKVKRPIPTGRKSEFPTLTISYI